MKTETHAILESMKARMVLPAICAPMFLVTGPDLMIAACEAGIMAALPGPNGRTIADLEAWFTRIGEHFTAARAAGRSPWSMVRMRRFLLAEY